WAPPLSPRIAWPVDPRSHPGHRWGSSATSPEQNPFRVGRVQASGEALARPYAFGGDVGPMQCKPGMNTIRAMDATSKGNHVLPLAGGTYQIKADKSPKSGVHRRCLMVHLVQLETRHRSMCQR